MNKVLMLEGPAIGLVLQDDLVTVIDPEDYDRVSPIIWYRILRQKSKQGCVEYTVYSAGHALSRFIMGAPGHLQVDHIDHDPLNNRKANLRLATPRQNQANTRIRVDNSSGYKGVDVHKRNPSKFRAQIRHEGKKEHIGSFVTVEEAARAYDKRATEIFGTFAYLNFPVES